MNFIEDVILFIFTLLLMLTLNLRISFGQEALTCNPDLSCAQTTIPHLNSKYIFIGEDHRDYKSKEFIISQLPNLKKLGFTTIFVEYIESKDQLILDKYNINPIEHRESAFRTYGQPGDWGYDPNSYLKLTDQLGAEGFNIRGLDRRSDLRINITSDDKMAMRDLHMFNVAKNFIYQNPKSKIIFFGGSSHAFVNSNLSAPSFYELFVNHYNQDVVTNIKVDYFNYDSVSRERLRLSLRQTRFRCLNDHILMSPFLGGFDFYLFEDTDEFLPTQDYPYSIAI